MDRSDASAGLTFLKNGAKETRTPDPLHAMQVYFAAKYLSPLTYRKSNKFFRAIFRAELACRPSLPKQPIRHVPQLRDVARDLLATSSLDRHLHQGCKHHDKHGEINQFVLISNCVAIRSSTCRPHSQLDHLSRENFKLGSLSAKVNR